MIESTKEFFNELFANRKNTAAVLILGITVLAVLIGVRLVQNTQIFKSKAALTADFGVYNTRNGAKSLAQMKSELKNSRWPDNAINDKARNVYYLYQRNADGRVMNCAVNYGDLNNMYQTVVPPGANGPVNITVVQKWDSGQKSCNNWFPLVTLKNTTSGKTYNDFCAGRWEKRFDQDAGNWSGPNTPYNPGDNPSGQVSTCYTNLPNDPGNYTVEVLYADRNDAVDKNGDRSTNPGCNTGGPVTAQCSFTAAPPLHTIAPYTGAGSVSCDANNVASFNWSAAPDTGSPLIGYWLRINKAPGSSWAPSNSPADLAVEGDRFISTNTPSALVRLTPGQYDDWTVQAIYSDSALSEMHSQGSSVGSLGPFVCPSPGGAGGSTKPTEKPAQPTKPAGPTGPSYTTTEFRISEDPNLGTNPNDPGWDNIPQGLRFTYDPSGENIIDYTLLARNCNNDPACNPYPRADHTVYVLFIAHDDAGNIKRLIEKNKITLTKAPKIDSVDCSISSTGAGSVAAIKGSNFGDSSTPGKVTVSDNTISSVSWSDSQVVANLTNQSGGTADVTLTTIDGLTAGPVQCTVGKSQLNFDAALACKTPTPLTGADVELFELSNNLGIGTTAPSGTVKSSIFKQAGVSFGPDGHAQLSVPDLTEGKAYKLVISAKNLLTRVVQFNAGRGTTDLNDVTVGVGDIFPTDKGDCSVNSLDKNQMIKDWSLDKDVVKKADLNGDGRVNSIDYSCLLINFNKSCDKL